MSVLEYVRSQTKEFLESMPKSVRKNLFVSRDKVFNAEQVLQETMIIKVRKTAKKPDNVLITSTDSSSDFEKYN